MSRPNVPGFLRTEGGVRESFWLNRKGRVQADLLIAEFGDAMLVDVDRFAAEATVAAYRLAAAGART